MTPSSPKSFNPWPVAIIAFFAFFICCTIGFIVFSTHQRVDLVTPDYYEQELRFQDQIDRVHRTASLHAETVIALEEDTRTLRVGLPPAHRDRHPQGTVALYRPSAAGLDRRFPLLADAEGRQRLDLGGFEPGLWRVQVSWTVDGVGYYRETNIVLGGAQPE